MPLTLVGWFGDACGQPVAKFVAVDFLGTQPEEVLGFHLAVDEVEVPIGKPLTEGGEGEFGAVGFQREHRLAEEGSPQRDAVQPADQFFSLPAFHRVGIAEFVQPVIGFSHFGYYPGAVVLRPANPGAMADHLPEGGVETGAVESLTDLSRQSFGTVKVFWDQDQAWGW